MSASQIALQSRVALVTGAGQGLGRTHAHALARYGAVVAVNDLSRAHAEQVAQEIVDSGGRAIACPADVADPDAVQAMIADVQARLGPVDLLVNNAGILRDRTFAKATLQDFRTVLDVNLMGSVHCTHAVWNGMRERGYGRIVFTTSSSGLYGNFGQANYSAAKMGLVGLMQTLAIEGQRHNIRVNCLAPSAATGMTSGLYANDDLARLDSERVSPAVVALCADDAPTRTILLAGAGRFAQAHVSMTRGVYLRDETDPASAVLASLAEIACREGEHVPASGPEQHRFEIAGLS
ncbi:SDR family NAD(P)-dependent oxidoreductase [Niveispirillum sp.]|uniref:SDR family NAD(P)-dependent oxidoreductase n=1 Tax=Niveispirillum sp. TaxID=1917217 RepID=UPI001B709D87|nr:SDR family NAD(P)-dependent oxidoreductase [Niveispirillum sp.]MBP7335277.1 SDR family NAD(P)-dependent oxidoreductase [Niveispirillum sp.]